MSDLILPDALVDHSPGGGSIVILVMDGVGGLPHSEHGKTELEVADTPHLDALAARSSLGLQIPVGQGITAGSGPGHLALFGYDPLDYQIGRGALSALGVGFDLRPGDVAIRLNLATLDGEGNVVDRRAGRPSDAEGARVVEKVAAALTVSGGVEAFIQHEKEHRAVLILRGEGLDADVEDTDPQETGVPPRPARARSAGAEATAEVVQEILGQAKQILRDEVAINAFLARGFARYQVYPSLSERFGLNSIAIARYPMYRGVARLVGMTVDAVPADNEETVALYGRYHGAFDYYFLHFKATDSRGEDGDFDAKVAAIEAIDTLLPDIVSLEPDVLVVTGDHSTPATYGAHSWHSVPVLIASRWARPTGTSFGEQECRGGDLGVVRGCELMALALAHAGRLAKFGA